MMKKAFFLDRDGVLNVEAVCMWREDRVELMPMAAEAVKLLRSCGYMAVVVSNQPWIGRQVCTVGDQWRVYAKLQEFLFAENTRLDGFYFCPHDPLKNPCNCRKPAPGMILQASQDLGIDIAGSFMIGDRLTDLETGRNAGCLDVGLVKTGWGADQLELAGGDAGCPVGGNLLELVEKLLEKHEKQSIFS